MEISGYKSPWQQAFFAVLVDRRDYPIGGSGEDRRDYRKKFMFPMLNESDKFFTCSIDLCYRYIDEIRTSSEATIACSVGRRKLWNYC